MWLKHSKRRFRPAKVWCWMLIREQVQVWIITWSPPCIHQFPGFPCGGIHRSKGIVSYSSLTNLPTTAVNKDQNKLKSIFLDAWEESRSIHSLISFVTLYCHHHEIRWEIKSFLTISQNPSWRPDDPNPAPNIPRGLSLSLSSSCWQTQTPPSSTIWDRSPWSAVQLWCYLQVLHLQDGE